MPAKPCPEVPYLHKLAKEAACSTHSNWETIKQAEHSSGHLANTAGQWIPCYPCF